MNLALHSVEVENLRGYERSRFPLDQKRTLLVGKNNSGKTSILKLIDWVLNDLDLDAVGRGTAPTQAEVEFLLPARKTRKRARRLWLRIKVPDARRHRRFKCEDGIASLRIDLKLSPQRRLAIKLGPPSRGETDAPDLQAVALLKELRKAVIFVHVPAFRDAGSDRFSSTLRSAFQARLAERALHARQAGAPSEYRAVKNARDSLRDVAEDLARPLWEAMQAHLPAGLARSAAIKFSCEPEDLVSWMAARLSMKIATGDHDENAVNMVELGSGLQSLLDLAIQKSADNPHNAQIVLAVEEPEAFLHPSAQRTLARLVMSDSAASNMIVTTHSPIIIEEAAYGDVVLVRDHEFFLPADLEEERREEINTALMSGFGAELMFATGALFVEGEGDRQLFEALRRRMAKADTTGRTDDAIVVPVGSKAHFAPWIELVRSYGSADKRPFQWLVVADGDAAQEVREAFNNARMSIPQAVGTALTAVKSAHGGGDVAEWTAAIRGLNVACRNASFPLRLLPVDLESAILEEASAPSRQAIAHKGGWSDIRGPHAKQELLQRLGSKAVANPGDRGKFPWLRGFIGRQLQWSEISQDFKTILTDWLETVMPRLEAKNLVESNDL